MLDTEALVDIIRPNGTLSKKLKSFESREQQQSMLANIVEAYNNKSISLIEAGTGTGKSFAYLIPALAAALKNQAPTVISTATINLQEQLFHKDIPLLLKALDLDVQVSLIKGMGNYLCIRKLDDLRQEAEFLSQTEQEEAEKIAAWSFNSEEGSKSDLPQEISAEIWEKLNADPYSCTHRDCQFFNSCHFFRNRRKAKDSQIYIVNHHLLFSDLVRRAKEDNYDKPSILPPYSNVILDEAHNIEDVATDFFGSRTGRMQTLRLLSKLISEKSGSNSGKLFTLKQQLTGIFGREIESKNSSILKKLNIDLVGMRHDLTIKLNDAFQAIATFIESRQTQQDSKLRMRPEHYNESQWKELVVPTVMRYIAAGSQLTHTLHSLDSDIQSLKEKQVLEKTAGTRADLSGLAAQLNEGITLLKAFLEEPKDTNTIRWIESIELKRGGQNINLIETRLDISKALAEHLFSKFHTIVLSSATITTNQQFDFFKKRLGLTEVNRTISEHVYSSPFNYQEQVLLAVPTDICEPSHPHYNQQCSEHIWRAIDASQGNAFILFTSYSSLKTIYHFLEDKLKREGYYPLKQGDAPRQALLESFKSKDRSILFGTDSFWEGVDVVGEALRCVIIAKLPFKVPTEPIIQARAEAIAESGGNAFMEFSVPDAIVKFKQGFGRLIRHKNDRGCIVCLDNRLIKKSYGMLFMNSLPRCKVLTDTGENIQKEMKAFYERKRG